MCTKCLFQLEMHAIWISGTNFIVKHFFCVFPLGFGGFRAVPREKMWKYEPIMSFHEVFLEKKKQQQPPKRKVGTKFSDKLSFKDLKVFCGLLTTHVCTRTRKKMRGDSGERPRGTRRVESGICERRIPFCAGVQFSRDSIRTFNDRIGLFRYIKILTWLRGLGGIKQKKSQRGWGMTN